MAATLLVLVTPALVFYSTYSQYSVPYRHQIQDSSNVSSYYSVSYSRTIKKSRQSTVQVISIVPDQGMMSAFSGTYFESAGGYFVVSVAHGISGPCENTKIVHKENVYDCKKYIHIDPIIDYSIIQIEQIPDRVPIKIPRDLPKNNQWTKSFSLLNKVLYTGFPNNLGPLTIGGEVAGFSPTEHAYILSYAWQGSSGSGVFDHSGKYIGYVVAIDVGQTEIGFQILQNVVLVMPAYNIDWTKAITEAE
jgi:hypothetical protein